MAAVVLTILSAGVVYTTMILGRANNVNEAFNVKNDKIEQVANPEIVKACSSLMPVYNSKGEGEYTFTCDINPKPTSSSSGYSKSDKGEYTKEIGGKKSRKTRRNRKSRRFRK